MVRFTLPVVFLASSVVANASDTASSSPYHTEVDFYHDQNCTSFKSRDSYITPNHTSGCRSALGAPALKIKGERCTISFFTSSGCGAGMMLGLYDTCYTGVNSYYIQC